MKKTIQLVQVHIGSDYKCLDKVHWIIDMQCSMYIIFISLSNEHHINE